MTELITYHHATQDIALFKSNDQFWIGSYFPQATHQNGEPPYLLIDGYWEDIRDGLQRLSELHGDEI